MNVDCKAKQSKKKDINLLLNFFIVEVLKK